MHIERLDRSWLEVPIFRHVISSPEQVQQLISYKVREVYIDTDKGSDVADVDSGAAPPVETVPPPPASVDLPTGLPLDAVPFIEEIAAADRTFHKALGTISSAMELARAGRMVQLEPVSETVDGMIASILRNRDAMTAIASMKECSEAVYQHCVRVCVLALVFGHHVGCTRDDLKALGMGAILHDIGKMQVPDEAQPSHRAMSEEQYKLYKKHPIIGAKYLNQMGHIGKRSLMILLQHHERADGSGFPLGLADDEILELSKLVVIADTYDKLTMREAPQERLTPYDAIRWIRTWGRQQYNAELVSAFEQALGLYPVGSFVRLSDNRAGIVLSVHHNATLLPRVWVVFDAEHRLLPAGQVVDLAAQEGRNPVTIISALNPEKLGIDLATYIKDKHVFSGQWPEPAA